MSYGTLRRKLLECFETETEALAAVRELIERNTPSIAQSLLLGRENKRGRSKSVAVGAELAARALATTSVKESLSA